MVATEYKCGCNNTQPLSTIVNAFNSPQESPASGTLRQTKLSTEIHYNMSKFPGYQSYFHPIFPIFKAATSLPKATIEIGEAINLGFIN